MALRLSRALRTKLLEGTQGLKQLFANGVMDIMSGAIPATADTVESGTLLARIVIGFSTFGSDGTGSGTCGTGLNFGTAAVGVITKEYTTWAGTGIATGEAGWFRFYDKNIQMGTLGTSGTDVRMDGVCAEFGGDLNMADLTVTAGGTTTVDSFQITLPAY